MTMGEMTPAAQAEAYYTEEERERISRAKELRCIECDYARAWCVGGTNMQTGYCVKHDMPLSSSELQSSKWDMCGTDAL